MASTPPQDSGEVVSALAELTAEPESDIESRVLAHFCRVPAPVGEAHAAFTDQGVLFLRTEASLGGDADRFREAFATRFGRPLLPAPEPPEWLVEALAGGVGADIAVDLRDSTAFAAEVLRVTARIPAGQTRTYAWVAKEVGRPGAVRAVGSALARNPVPLLIPCHRVIRSDGGLGDYLFGVETKERLLREEASAARR